MSDLSASPVVPPGSSLSYRLFIATRPWSFPATVGGISVGSALFFCHASSSSFSSVSSSSSFSLSSFLLTLLIALVGAVSVHSAGNLTNTLQDFKSGLDKKDTSDDRALVDGFVSESSIFRLTMISYILSIIVTLYFIFAFSSAPSFYSSMTNLLCIVLAGIACAHAYTAPPLKLKYRGLGDIVILIAFGPLLVIGGFLVHDSHASSASSSSSSSASSSSLSSLSTLLSLLWFSIPVACVTEGILHVNNTRDMKADKRANALTVARIVGFNGSFQLYRLLFVVSFTCVVLLSYVYSSWVLLGPCVMIPEAVKLTTAFRKKEWQGLCERNGQFAALFDIIFAVSIAAAAKQIQI